MKSGDTQVRFSQTLTKDGVAFDLTGLKVFFVLKTNGIDVYSVEASIVSPANGTVQLITGDVLGFPTTPGTYEQCWQVKDLAGTTLILTFPSTGFNEVVIERNL